MPYSVRMVKRASIGIVIGALLVGSLAGCGSSDTQVVSVGEPIEPDPMLVDANGENRRQLTFSPN